MEGFTLSVPDADRVLATRSELGDRLSVLLGGRSRCPSRWMAPTPRGRSPLAMLDAEARSIVGEAADRATELVRANRGLSRPWCRRWSRPRASRGRPWTGSSASSPVLTGRCPWWRRDGTVTEHHHWGRQCGPAGRAREELPDGARSSDRVREHAPIGPALGRLGRGRRADHRGDARRVCWCGTTGIASPRSR